MADEHLKILENLRTNNPEYRGIDDGKLLAALVHAHPGYAKAIGDQGLRMALQSGHTPRSAAPPRPVGMRNPGTINLTGRPIIPTPGQPGYHSSEISFSRGTDQGEVLVPQVVNGRVLSQDEAWQHYLNTGEHMGIFDTPEHADAYAEQVHQRPLRSSGPAVYVYPVEQDIKNQPPSPGNYNGQ
jgi:hypothetical protein